MGLGDVSLVVVTRSDAIEDLVDCVRRPKAMSGDGAAKLIVVSPFSSFPPGGGAAGKEINDEEEKNAGDQIDTQRVDVTNALSLHEFIRQAPGFDQKQPEGLKKALVEIEKSVSRIGQDRTKGAMIINRRLAALRAIPSGQSRATILAMGQWRALLLLSPEPSSPRITLHLGRGRVPEDQRGFIRHERQIIQGTAASPTRKESPVEDQLRAQKSAAYPQRQ